MAFDRETSPCHFLALGQDKPIKIFPLPKQREREKGGRGNNKKMRRCTFLDLLLMPLFGRSGRVIARGNIPASPQSSGLKSQRESLLKCLIKSRPRDLCKQRKRNGESRRGEGGDIARNLWGMIPTFPFVALAKFTDSQKWPQGLFLPISSGTS